MVDFRTGTPADIPPGRPVIVGFPQDEGVRRNGGRIGAAHAPDEIRRWLYRLTPYHAAENANLTGLGILDIGNLVVSNDLEASQAALAEVVGELLHHQAIPIVLGGGHETAYGVYLGHVRASHEVAIINLDAHLDVRPTVDHLGHSGSPFRQAMEHPERPLPGSRYACFGAQPFSVSREHLEFVQQRGGMVCWNTDGLERHLRQFESQHLGTNVGIHLSIDADVVRSSEVPGVSAPNPMGLSGDDVVRFAFQCGADRRVVSLELVEINPRFDVDGRSARWGAVVIWHFLAGLASRFSEA